MRWLINPVACAMVLTALIFGAEESHLFAQSGSYTGTIDYGVRVQDKEVVLFPFDSDAIPFRSGVQLGLLAASRHGENPVVPVGEPGQADSSAVTFYGTVIPIGDEFRMWYLCAGDEKGYGMSWIPDKRLRVCYALSKDGVKWEKPSLGLVDYDGNKNNNLVALQPVMGDAISAVIIYDPEDPDSGRRFKMMYENHGGSDSGAYSADGLTWTNVPGNPVIKPVIEPSGFIKYNGMYYLVGHGHFEKRVLVVDASPDFLHWTDAVSVGFRRDNVGPLDPILPGTRSGEQIHLGAALWNRGNVILGLYGQWHGPSLESNDRRDMRLDVGFVISHDALHYHEPIPGFQMLSGADEKFATLGFVGRIIQSQAFLNVGNQTLTYYSHWGPGGGDGIYLATWARDRFGYFAVTTAPVEGQAPTQGVDPQFISCPIVLDKPQTNVYVNTTGLGQYTQISVEVLDDKFRPIPGFSGDDAIPLTEDGFHEQVKWRDKDSITKFDHPVRLRVIYSGLQRERARVYAIYLK